MARLIERGISVNAVRRGFRNAFRNTMRSVGVIVILAVAIALSISMLIARDAVSAKINSVRSSTGNTISVSPKGFFGFTGGGTSLTATEINALLALPNVTAVQESLSEELRSGSTSLSSPTVAGSLGGRFGNFSGSGATPGGVTPGTVPGGSTTTFSVPVRVIGTNSPGTALVGGANGGGTEKLTSGTSFSANSKADVAVVGSALATKNKLQVGSTFTAWNTKITVVGIFTAGSTFTNASALMPIATVQKLAAAPGQVTAATVVVDSIDHVAGAQAAITKQLGSVADVTSTQQIVQAQLAPLNTVKTISTYTLLGSVVAAALILLLSMLMIVRERRREIGVLKAIGAPNSSIIAQFIAESTTFTAIGAIVGFVGGVLISSPITSALVSSQSTTSASTGGFVRGPGGAGFSAGGTGFTPPAGGGGAFGHFGGFTNTLTQIHASAGWSTLAFALLAALVIAALGSTVATATIVRIRPAEVLRSE